MFLFLPFRSFWFCPVTPGACATAASTFIASHQITSFHSLKSSWNPRPDLHVDDQAAVIKLIFLHQISHEQWEYTGDTPVVPNFASPSFAEKPVTSRPGRSAFGVGMVGNTSGASNAIKSPPFGSCGGPARLQKTLFLIPILECQEEILRGPL